MAVNRQQEAGASSMAAMMAQMRKNMGGQIQQAQGVSASGGSNSRIGPQPNKFAQAPSVQPGSGISGPAGVQAAQRSQKPQGDQLAQFQQQLGSGIKPNLNKPPMLAEGQGTRFSASA